MRLKKIIISFCLITMIAFNQTYEVYADAGSLVVAGGAIGVAGVGVAGLTGPVVVAVFLGLMAFGMNVELTKASEQAGMTKTQFVKSKLEQYCQEANIAQSTFGSYVLEQAEIFNDGRIKLSDKAAQMIKRFGNWLFENDMVQNPGAGSGTQEGTINIGNQELINISNSSVLKIGYDNEWHRDVYVRFSNITGTVGLCISNLNNNYSQCLTFFSNVQNTGIGAQVFYYSGDNIRELVSWDYSIKTRVKTYDLFYTYFRYGYTLDLSGSDIPVYDGYMNDLLDGTDGTFENVGTGAGTADDTFTGSRDDWASGNPALDPAQDQSLVVNPDLINSIPIPADKDLTWDVNSYLDALEKALDKVANPDVPAVDDATGLPVSIPIPDTITLDPTADRVDNPDLPSQKTPVIDPNKQPEGEQAVDPLKFDLKNIFPFCLPWDIKDMLNLLKANPQAPSYHVDWHIPIINTDLEFTVDLSPFNSVASVARKMELLGFVIGLAVITRRLIRG